METHPKIGRMLVGAESYADAEAALRLVTILATGRSVDLGGLLVLDAALEGAPRWPGQRIVTETGMMLLAPSQDQMRSLIESEARAFRGRLNEIAHACALGCSFEAKTGDLMRSIAQAVDAWDVLLLGHRTLHRRVGPVVYLDASPDYASDARSVAALLADALKTSAIALDARTGAADPKNRVFSRIDRLNASAVVIDAGKKPVLTLQELSLLLERARCPVVVLRVSKLETRPKQSEHPPPTAGGDVG